MISFRFALAAGLLLVLVASRAASAESPAAPANVLDAVVGLGDEPARVDAVPSWAQQPDAPAAPAVSEAAPVPPTPGGPPAPIPVDGGLTLLAAAGIGYGVRRLRARLARGAGTREASMAGPRSRMS